MKDVVTSSLHVCGKSEVTKQNKVRQFFKDNLVGRCDLSD